MTITPAAGRELERLPADVAARLRVPLRALAANPRPVGATPLVGSGFWRIRIGDIRIVYVIDDDAKVVRIDRVARRAESSYRRPR
jgi:mRNA interferase RelE/StbE